MNRQIFKTNRSMLLFHFIFKCIKHTRRANMLTQELCFNRDRCSTPRMSKNNNNSNNNNNNNNMIMACWVDIYPHKVWVLYFWSRSSFFLLLFFSCSISCILCLFATSFSLYLSTTLSIARPFCLRALYRSLSVSLFKENR